MVRRVPADSLGGGDGGRATRSDRGRSCPARSGGSTFRRAGWALVAGFVVLRAINLYGDPHPWTAEGGPVRAVLSFLDCEKYPPSLLFLAMTLGPALCVLAWMDRPLGPWAARVAIYGRVPLFYYVLHLFAAPRAWRSRSHGPRSA